MGGMEAVIRMNIFLSLLAGFLAGTAGAMGLGGGSVLLIYLTVFAGVSQLTAQGINLIFFLPTAALAVAVYAKRGQIEWKSIWSVMLFGTVGTLIASYLVSFIPSALMKKFFGGLIIAYGLFEVFAPKRKTEEEEKKADRTGGKNRTAR